MPARQRDPLSLVMIVYTLVGGVAIWIIGSWVTREGIFAPTGPANNPPGPSSPVPTGTSGPTPSIPPPAPPGPTGPSSPPREPRVRHLVLSDGDQASVFDGRASVGVNFTQVDGEDLVTLHLNSPGRPTEDHAVMSAGARFRMVVDGAGYYVYVTQVSMSAR